MSAQPLVYSLSPDVTVAIFNTGDLYFDLARGLTATEAEWRPRYSEFFAEQQIVPVQCMLVQTPATTVLVDAASYEGVDATDFGIPGYTPPPPLPERIAAYGVDPAAVEHLVITHLHFDHYNGLTYPAPSAGEHGRALAFPNAQVHIGAADMDLPHVTTNIADPTSNEGRTLAVAQAHSLLHTVSAETDLAPGVTIVPMPGETLGHLGLRVAVPSGTLYHIGDLVHHPVEFEQTAWAVSWANQTAMQVTRSALLPVFADTDDLLVASHIPGIGRIHRTANAYRWETVLV